MPSTEARAAHIERRLKASADPARVSGLQAFFKTGPGQYGEGDRFLGVTMPQIRRLAVEFRGTPLDQIERLLEAPWHEARMLAVVSLATAYPRSDARQRASIYRLYLRRTDRINNWDLVALKLLRDHLAESRRSGVSRRAFSGCSGDRRSRGGDRYAPGPAHFVMTPSSPTGSLSPRRRPGARTARRWYRLPGSSRPGPP